MGDDAFDDSWLDEPVAAVSSSAVNVPAHPTASGAASRVPVAAAPAAGSPAAVDEDVAFFSGLATAPRWTQRSAPSPTAFRVAPALPLFGGGGGTQDDGVSFFEEAGGSPSGAAPPGVGAAPAALPFHTPRRAAAEDVDYFAALQHEVGGADGQRAHQQPGASPAQPAQPVALRASPWNSPAQQSPAQPAAAEVPLVRQLSWSSAQEASEADFFDRLDQTGNAPPAAAAPDSWAPGAAVAMPQATSALSAPSAAAAAAAAASSAAAAAVSVPQPASASDADFFESLGSPRAQHAEAAAAATHSLARASLQPEPADLPLAQHAHAEEPEQPVGESYGAPLTEASAQWYAPVPEQASGAEAVAVAAPLPEGWECGCSPEGYTYYFNTLTGESTWEPPPAPAPAQAPSPLPWGDSAAYTAHEQHAQYEQQPVVEPAAAGWAASPVYAAPSPLAQPAFQAYPAAAQQHPAVSAQPSGLQADASRSPHGRPACPTLCFGIDGTLVTHFPLSATRLACAAPYDAAQPDAVLLRPTASLLRAAGPDSVGGAYLRDLERFAAPLGAGAGGVMAGMGLARHTSLGDLARLAEEQGAQSCGSASSELLWGVLRLMCLHRGSLSEEAGATALLALLREAGGRGAASPAQPDVPGGAAAAASASEVERLLLQGQRCEAVATALSARLWGPALLLARSLGEHAAAEAYAACVRGCAVPGTPLHTALCMAAGLPPDPAQHRGLPDAPGAHALYTQQWRHNLAALLCSRAAGDGAAMVALGDALWAQGGDCCAAHMCYILAGVPPLPYGPGARLCLVGGDHRQQPRSFARPAALHATELLEACLRGANPQAAVPALQAYRMGHAGALAEVGRGREALLQVETAARALRAAGPAAAAELNVPVFTQVAQALEERLRGSAGGARGGGKGGAAAAKLLGGLSSLLDKGISSIFGDEGGHADAGGPAAQQQQPLQQQAGPPLQPQAHHSPAPSHGRSGSDASEVDGSRAPSRAVSPSVEDGSGGGAGMVRSLSSFFGAPFRRKNEAKLGDSNKFYFDEQLKMWVEEGKAPPAAPEAPPPPPTHLAAPVAGPPVGGGGFSARALGSGVRARYVDTFNSAAGQAGGAEAVAAAPPDLTLLGLPPRPKAGPARPAFFVPGPAAEAQQQAYEPPPAAEVQGQQQPQQYAVLNATVDAPPPPNVGYGELLPPAGGEQPPAYAQAQGGWAGGGGHHAHKSGEWGHVDL